MKLLLLILVYGLETAAPKNPILLINVESSMFEYFEYIPAPVKSAELFIYRQFILLVLKP